MKWFRRRPRYDVWIISDEGYFLLSDNLTLPAAQSVATSVNTNLTHLKRTTPPTPSITHTKVLPAGTFPTRSS